LGNELPESGAATVKKKYQFELLLSKQDGSPLETEAGQLGPIAIEPDFQPAREWAKFQHQFQSDAPMQAELGNPEPIWDTTAGEPYVREFAIEAGHNGDGLRVVFPTTYFGGTARTLSSLLVSKGILQPGELFNYLVTSHPIDTSAAQKAGGAPSGLTVKRTTPALDFREDIALASLIEVSEPFETPSGADMPVFVEQEVMDTIEAQAIEAGAMECGAFLLGHLHRCPDTKNVFLTISAQVPAEHVTQEMFKLSFSAESFSAARQAVSERGCGEMIVGWAHSHAYMHHTCKDCQKRDAGACCAKADFFSDDDIRVHRTCFLRAFCSALVVSSAPCSGINWAMYGWNRGMVCRKGFYVIPKHKDRKET